MGLDQGRGPPRHLVKAGPGQSYLYSTIISRPLSFHLGNKLCSSTLLYDLFLHTLSSSDLLSSTIAKPPRRPRERPRLHLLLPLPLELQGVLVHPGPPRGAQPVDPEQEAVVKVERGKLDDDILVEAAEKGLFYRKRIGILPETGATGGVLCAPDLANVGPRGYSPETIANCRGGGDSVFIDDAVVVVMVVEAELFAGEDGHFVRRVCGLRRQRWRSCCCCGGGQTVEEWGEIALTQTNY
ncbi:hypothetical protein RHSIM_Rhsim02G0116100 [Rhododendron simsii]|uniref:Uncharacterized protein n=1 Tax=Rhododendron simsii TaxID=118357 RepID=A0A834LZ22_RHOSS|nr:hypothetical protein RHSIM_Rhsim02G0116100 [Rhododendron simsii]